MARTRDVLDELAEGMRRLRAGLQRGRARRPRDPSSRPLRPASASAVRRAFVRVVEALLAWHDQARERRSLMELSDQMPRDIGISGAEALGAAARTSRRI